MDFQQYPTFFVAIEIYHFQVIWTAVGFEVSPISGGQAKMDLQWVSPTSKHVFFMVLSS